MSRRSKAIEFLEDVYNISITGRNVMVTDAMKDYAIEKISKIERFSSRIIDVAVIMDVQRFEHRVDIIMKVDHFKIKSSANTDNMYESIDKAAHKIEAQLLRYKSKIQDYHLGKGHNSVDMSVNVLGAVQDEEVLEVNNDIEEETRRRLLDKYSPHKIIDRETHSLKTITDGEAIMKMDLSEDNFLIYRGEEDRKIKVIYRRNDGNFGVIQAEA
ncbi:MAG: ribosome-associated translation inhibitor RaiA [Parachlamydiaceae bacterium]|nr:ribosome-associated translation inhibitor RaiA [Parachlamydiaceae bacterium]